MNHDEFQAVFNRQVKQCGAKLLEKSAEYATEEDKLHNFKVAATLNGETPEQALWGMQTKHIVSISDMVQSGKQFPKEVWDEKLGDFINYAILLRAQIFETEMDQSPVNPEDLTSMMSNGSDPVRVSARSVIQGNISRS
jgi:hypothetical protein